MDKISKKLDSLLNNTGDMALKRRAKLIIKSLQLKDGDKVLDLGCGDGFYLHLLASLPVKLKLVGSDVDPNALISAKNNLKKTVKLIRADAANKLPFRDQEFDKIILSEVLEHIENDQKAIKEAVRVLKLNGIICISVPSKNYPFLWDPINWLLDRFGTHIKTGFWSGIWSQHLRLYSDEELLSLVGKTDLEVSKVNQVTFWCLPFNHYLVNLVARLFYSHNLGEELTTDLSKFNSKQTHQSWLVSLAFKIVNLIDKLNDIIPVRKFGVSIFLKGVKIK